MELLVLNTDFESIAVIDTYESMIWTDRYNSYGDFEIFFAMDTQLLQYLKEDYYLWLKDSEHCMIIEDIKINADTEEGNHQPRARACGLPCGHAAAAGLARSVVRAGIRRAAPRLPCDGRQYGLHGQSLFRRPPPPPHGCLYARRRDGQAAGLCDGRLLQPHPPQLSEDPDPHRRHRGQPAPPGTL